MTTSANDETLQAHADRDDAATKRKADELQHERDMCKLQTQRESANAMSKLFANVVPVVTSLIQNDRGGGGGRGGPGRYEGHARHDRYDHHGYDDGYDDGYGHRGGGGGHRHYGGGGGGGGAHHHAHHHGHHHHGGGGYHPERGWGGDQHGPDDRGGGQGGNGKRPAHGKGPRGV